MLDVFHDAKEYGSILHVEQRDYQAVLIALAEWERTCELTLENHSRLEQLPLIRSLLRQAEIMAQNYDVVVTNPPYMGISNGNGNLNHFVKKYYPDSKADLFAVFIEKCGHLIKKHGYQAMITSHSWMFLSSFEKLRKKLQLTDTVNMAHLGARAFEEISGEVVQTASWVQRKSNIVDYLVTYVRLVDYGSQQEKERAFLAKNDLHFAQKENFSKIPGIPIAYWVSEKMTCLFDNDLISNVGETREGITTANNELFLRLWHEVLHNLIEFKCNSQQQSQESDKKWFLHHKGGEYKKWYGNMEYVINWENGGEKIRKYSDNITGRIRSHNYNLEYNFHEYATWSRISSEKMGMRYSPPGFVFDTASAALFLPQNLLFYGIGFICSVVAKPLLMLLNPTTKFQPGDVANLPFIIRLELLDNINNLVSNNIEISKTDWNSFETSWDFVKHPFFKGEVLRVESEVDISLTLNAKLSTLIKTTYEQWEITCNERFTQLKANEEELNRIFIDIYGLQDELTPEVDDKDITIRKADLQRDIRSFISYAVGCMFGRYSLDVDGLVYAGGDFTNHYPLTTNHFDSLTTNHYHVDADNVIPITDTEYFSDDIVTRFVEFIKVVYGQETLEENLDFTAQALGNKGNTSREIIRNYFLKDFYADHVKVYQKRPIYWLFDSGKENGFKALMYMHRYDQDTVGRVRADYLHKAQAFIENAISHCDVVRESNAPASEKAKAVKQKEKLVKQLAETRLYDQAIAHIAYQRIAIELDDGVVVNYAKFQGVEVANEGKKAVKIDLLAKV